VTTSKVIGAAAVMLLSACDKPAGLRVDFSITHTDQMENARSTPLDLPPEPAIVQGGTNAVEAGGLIAAPDACDDLDAEVESAGGVLTVRVIVKGSRSHPGGCGGPGRFALFQWRANVEPVEPGPHRVRILYDYRGLRSHSTGAETGRDPYANRVVAEGTVIVKQARTTGAASP
jgi:hypothetical protein